MDSEAASTSPRPTSDALTCPCRRTPFRVYLLVFILTLLFIDFPPPMLPFYVIPWNLFLHYYSCSRLSTR